MTAQPIHPGQPQQPDKGSYQVIGVGEDAAVALPMTDFLRLQALEQQASAEALEDAEDLAALHHWQAREAAGQTTYTPADEVRRRLCLTR